MDLECGINLVGPMKMNETNPYPVKVFRFLTFHDNTLARVRVWARVRDRVNVRVRVCFRVS